MGAAFAMYPHSPPYAIKTCCQRRRKLVVPAGVSLHGAPSTSVVPKVGQKYTDCTIHAYVPCICQYPCELRNR